MVVGGRGHTVGHLEPKGSIQTAASKSAFKEEAEFQVL